MMVEREVPAGTVAHYAELVSPTSTSCRPPASPATTTRPRRRPASRERLLERLAEALLVGAGPVELEDLADRGRLAAVRDAHRGGAARLPAAPGAPRRRADDARGPVRRRARRAGGCGGAPRPRRGSRAGPRCIDALDGRGAVVGPDPPVDRGAPVLRPGPTGRLPPDPDGEDERHRGAPRRARRRGRCRRPRRPAPPRPRTPRRGPPRHRGHGWPRRCGRGCCTRVDERTSPPSSTCTLRPSATG